MRPIKNTLLEDTVDPTKYQAPVKKNKSTPARFKITEQGVYYDPPEGDSLPICSKLEIKALVRDSASENWGRLLIFRDADNQEHTWAMPMQMLKGSGEELRSELFRMGLDISANKRARNLLIEYITSSKPELRARCVSRTGWYNNVFVFPNRTIGDSLEIILYQSENPIRDYCQAGTLADWQKNNANYCCGNSLLIFAVSTAFAALLLYPAGSESGGIHIVGESSSGKTTALRVAASVYGAPDYLNRWRATTNGLEVLAAQRSDTLLILDELAQIDAKEAGEIAYMLANGSGKTRAGKTGGTRPRNEWRLLFLSAGEIGLAQHMREAGKQTKAGQAVRLVELPADGGQGLGLFENLHEFMSPAMFSKALTEASARYYGVGATGFLEIITQPEISSSLRKIIGEHYQSFLQLNLPIQASGQAVRVCERFALIAAAGEIASSFQITGWPQGIARDAAATCYKAWLQQRGGAGNQEHMALLQQVQAFFEAHGASRFENMDGTNDHRIPNRVGFRRLMQSENRSSEYEYFILPEMFRQEICQGFDSRWAAKELIDAGMLQPNSTGNAQIPYRLPGAGVKKCYHFIRTVPVCKDE